MCNKRETTEQMLRRIAFEARRDISIQNHENKKHGKCVNSSARVCHVVKIRKGGERYES